MIILTITAETKEKLLQSLKNIKGQIEEGYHEGYSFENHWEIKQED